MNQKAVGVRVEVRPIASNDIGRVAHFLSAELNSSVSAPIWEAAIRQPWQADAPNYGFMLVQGDEVVGVYLAFYSTRIIDGQAEKVCNLAAWCVQEAHRAHGLRLIKSMMGQQGYSFTDLSPSGNVIELNKRMGFQLLDTTTALVANLPWVSFGTSITNDPAAIQSRLTGRASEIYRDHASAPAANHLVVSRNGRHCHVIFRKDKRKRVRAFASILYVSDPELFAQVARGVFSYFLRCGLPLTLLEKRVANYVPKLAFTLPYVRPKMFRSARLQQEQVDYLYSELTCVPW